MLNSTECSFKTLEIMRAQLIFCKLAESAWLLNMNHDTHIKNTTT